MLLLTFLSYPLFGTIRGCIAADYVAYFSKMRRFVKLKNNPKYQIFIANMLKIPR